MYIFHKKQSQKITTAKENSDLPSLWSVPGFAFGMLWLKIQGAAHDASDCFQELSPEVQHL